MENAIQLTPSEYLSIAVAFFAALIIIVTIVANAVIEWRRTGKQPSFQDLATLAGQLAGKLDNQYTRSGVDTLFDSLPEAYQVQVKRVIENLSPLTNLTEFEWDDDLAAWLNQRATVEKKEA